MALSEQPHQKAETDALTPRLQLLGRVFVVMLVLWGLFVVGRHLLHPDTPVSQGGDFAAFWAAAKLALAGRAADAFLPEVAFPLQHQAIARDTILLWHYPPTWTLVISPFGLVDFPLALLLFQLLSLLAWGAAMRWLLTDLDRWSLACFALGPAVWVTLNQGQNGLLVAALLIVVARGLVHGGWKGPSAAAAALMIKPHLGLLIPVAWMARGHWRAIAATTGLSLAFLALSGWVFGAGYWRAFLDNGPALARALAGGDLWPQQITVYAALAQLGVPNAAALSVQAAVSVVLISMGWQVFRCRQAPELGAAFLLMVAPSLPPYAFHYDLCGSLAALALLLPQHRARPFLPWQMAVLVLVYLLPPFHRPIALGTGVSLAAPVLLAAALVIWQRAGQLRRAAA